MDSAIIFLFVSVIVIGIVLMAIITLTRKSPGALNKEQYQQQWLSIEQSAGTKSRSLQFAILEADRLLDKALKERGFRGETMGERMKSAQKTFSNPNVIWAAHKLRNRIAHESDVTVNKKLASQALAGFKRGLRDIGAL